MTYKETHKPKVGSKLHLAHDYWHGNNLVGAEATVISSRKRIQCASRLQIIVSMNGAENVGLCARWFTEYGAEFNYQG